MLLLCDYAAANVNATREQLKTVDQAISQTEETISTQKNRLEKVQQELQHTETVMSEWYAKLAKTNLALQKTNATIQQLQSQQTQLNQSRDRQRQALAAQVKAQYFLGQKHPLKNLLNNENNATIDRISKYAEILAQSRLDIISSLAKTEASLSEQKITLEKHQNELTELQKEQQHAQHKLQDQLQQRQLLVTNIDQSISTQQVNLNHLIENKKQLHALLLKLQHSNTYSSQYFAQHRGHLAWPVKGKIISEFGQPVKDSQLKTSGIVINAKSGNTVRAVAPGKVVFADWMPGFGFLMIIDHGQSYMSLYGHNQRLLLPVGAIVAPGDEISTVGNTGGQPQPGLYFGIRHEGKPTNPQNWLS